MKQLEQLTDEKLVRLYIRGDENCLAVLVKRHQQRLFGYIMILVRSRTLADDVFQETFFRIIRQLKKGEYVEDGKFLAWALRIAHNLCIDGFREKKDKPTVSHVKTRKTGEFVDIFSVIDVPQDAHDETIIKTEQYRELKNLVKQLPKEQHDVIVMRTFLGMSFKEIADQTGTNLNTALGRMRYGMIRLKELVKTNEVFKERCSEEVDLGGSAGY